MHALDFTFVSSINRQVYCAYQQFIENTFNAKRHSTQYGWQGTTDTDSKFWKNNYFHSNMNIIFLESK